MLEVKVGVLRFPSCTATWVIDLFRLGRTALLYVLVSFLRICCTFVFMLPFVTSSSCEKKLCLNEFKIRSVRIRSAIITTLVLDAIEKEVGAGVLGIDAGVGLVLDSSNQQGLKLP